jgi:hypothetical protein
MRRKFISKSLTRIIHEASTAAAQTGMSALRSAGLSLSKALSVLSSTPAEPEPVEGPSFALAGKQPGAPCIHARLHRLATNLHE